MQPTVRCGARVGGVSSRRVSKGQDAYGAVTRMRMALEH